MRGAAGFMCSHRSESDRHGKRKHTEVLTSTLLGFDQSGGSVYADNEAAGDLGV